MKSYYFTKTIDPESTQELMNFIEENEGDLTIYLRCGGGEDWAREVMSDCMEKNKDRITLITNGYIYSNAFRLFFSFTGKRIVMGDTIGMFHQSSKKTDITESGKPQYLDDIEAMKRDKIDHKISLKWCKDIGLTDKEIRKFKRMDDVYFTEARLRELLDAQIKNAPNKEHN